MATKSESTELIAEGLYPPHCLEQGRKILNCDAIDTVRFDPRKHLQIEPPSHVKSMDFEYVNFPFEQSPPLSRDGQPLQMAYSAPFRLLSDEGVKVMKSIVETSAERGLRKQGGRNNAVRGMSYVSDFVRDFTFDPAVNRVMSDLANCRLWPHSCTMNHGHTNLGEIATGKSADQWHIDSVDYVFVLILSDLEDMEGGDLQVLQMPDAGGHTFDNLQVNGVPSHLVETVKYPKAGYCILMQGSCILHSVTPVMKAREPRLSFVQSFVPLDVFQPDKTRLQTFREQSGDPAQIANLEFARHKAWRIKNQMHHIVDNLDFSASDAQLANIFEHAARELNSAANVLTGRAGDLPGFIVTEKDTVTGSGVSRQDKEDADDKITSKL